MQRVEGERGEPPVVAPASAASRQHGRQGRVPQHHPQGAGALDRARHPHRGEPTAAVLLADPPGDHQRRAVAVHSVVDVSGRPVQLQHLPAPDTPPAATAGRHHPILRTAFKDTLTRSHHHQHLAPLPDRGRQQ